MHNNNSHPLLVIAGPCSAESERQVMQTAEELYTLGIRNFRASLWKPRTRPGGFEGVGAKGIPWLQRVKRELGMNVTTEVATPEHVREVLEADFDTLWVGARTTSSPFAIDAIARALRAKSGITVMVKNPINPDLNLWVGAIMRFRDAGIDHIKAIHRGFSTYGVTSYRNPPHWQIPLELKRLYPDMDILVDPSHITGRSELVASVCQLALDMHFDGLIVESHCNPHEALSDSRQQIRPKDLGHILRHLHRPDANPSDKESMLTNARMEIDRIDEQLIELLAERQRISRQIGNIKAQYGMPVVQTERFEETLKTRREWAVNHHLRTEYVDELWNIIHEESIKKQKKDIDKHD
ncbi:cytochrome C4 [Porphyromonas macacae]|uniref:chorismate mutase n=1 Tax=Porphyromonas macacae TaxID=28115 RepID=A0A0A2E9E1_9PORP|nr:bifunctional 3-deoxy-7-phosphoheptulonate synthase/chorismate mutase type II [Porphyromonas macacae]KGN74055.1 cytochrome C4 [Porphyromonas macacae]SUB88656.1 3-deoxy-7-phosphoheptulonate synthase [Porphyromonas macacae]